MHLDSEQFPVLGTLLTNDRVAGLRTAMSMSGFLQGRFVIHDGQAAPSHLAQVFQLRFEDRLDDKAVRRSDTCIKVQRRNNSLERVNQQGSLGAAAALLLTTPKAQVAADV